MEVVAPSLCVRRSSSTGSRALAAGPGEIMPWERGGCRQERERERERERRDKRNDKEELGFLDFYFEPSVSQPSILI